MFISLSISVYSQDWEIPEKMTFVDMELQLSSSVRKTLKTEVDNIRRNPKYFQLKVDRANLYFPIIEKVFREENFPEDFKYLALQESNLISDAVSSSKAVGYWQFKKESAQEVGLRVDYQVDERMNIVASTRGAAKYLRRNNGALNNWIYALLSYNLGLGGVKKHVEERYVGAKKMKIDNGMHWYVIRFLAHKIAYEHEVGKAFHPELKLVEYTECNRKTLNEISRETGVGKEELLDYNKWCLRGKVPEDKSYTVILPVKHDQQIVLNTGQNGTIDTKERKSQELSNTGESKTPATAPTGPALLTNHNKLRAVKARPGDTFEALARFGGVKLELFLLYNEVKKYESPVPGEIYYLQPKRNKGLLSEHVVLPGENIWKIGQAYGMRSGSVRKKNRMKLNEEPLPGRVLLLRSKLKRGEKIRYKPVEKKKTEEKKLPEIKEVKKTEKEPIESIRTEEPKELVAEDSFVLVKTPEIAEPVTEAGKDEYFEKHVVAPSQTLYSISKIYNVTVDDLIRWNNLDGVGLQTGAVLKVLKKKDLADPVVVEHEVKAGETLYGISRMYGVTVQEILNLNHRKDNSLSVGEKLKIKTN